MFAHFCKIDLKFI